MSTTISGTNGVTFPDSTSMQTGQQACKAWVNFNGSGTVAIRESYNVSSITDNGTGDYTINFTTAMVNANYAVVSGPAGTYNDFNAMATQSDIPTVSSVKHRWRTENGSTVDPVYCHVAIFSN